MANTGAVAELLRHLDVLDAECKALADEQDALSARVDAVTRRRDALLVAIEELGGGAASADSVIGSPPSGPRPAIRQLAIEWAERHGGTVRIRDFVRETQAHGFRSDHGGLHTSLSGMREFEHSGPGEFTLRPDAVDRGDS